MACPMAPCLRCRQGICGINTAAQKWGKFMNESYAEASVKQKASPVNLLIKVLLVAAVIFVLLFGMAYFGPFAIVAVGVLILVCVLVFPYLSVEQMAPSGSHALDSYQNNPNVKTVDFTSKERDIKPYVIIVRQGEQLTKILFEPSEKMVAMIKQKAPRKVSDY